MGALAALAFACPEAAFAAPVTGPAIGVTPTTVLVTATGAGDGSRVVYGTDTSYGGEAPASTGGDEFALAGLTPNTTYHYRVESPGANDTWVPGGDRTVKTGAAGAPEVTTRPSAAQANAALVCSPGTWSAGSLLVSMTWWQGATQVPGVTGTSFVPGAAGDFACRVTMISNASTTSYMTSRPAHYTPPPPPKLPPRATTAPAIGGDLPAHLGGVLTCDLGEWTGASALDVRWLRDGTGIAGAISSEYAVTADDLGHSLVCEVVARGPGGTTVVRTAAVDVPAPPPPPPVGPAVVSRPAIAAGGPASTPPINVVLVGPLDASSQSSSDDDEEDDPRVSASAALRTLLTGPLPGRRAFLRPTGARVRFRPPEPLGMLRVKLVAGDKVLAVGARWYDTARPGVARIRLTAAGRRMLRSSRPVAATLVVTYVPDHGKSESQSRSVLLSP